MRTGRRYSRSAGTRSPAWPAAPAAAPVPAAAGAAVAGFGVPVTGTGPGGGAVGSGFPSASTTPASQGAAGAGVASSPASPLGRPPGEAAPGTVPAGPVTPAAARDRLVSATAAGGRRSAAWAAPEPGRVIAASATSAPQRRNCWPAGTGRSPGRPISPGEAAPGATPAGRGRIGKYKPVIPNDIHVISAGPSRDLSGNSPPGRAAGN